MQMLSLSTTDLTGTLNSLKEELFEVLEKDGVIKDAETLSKTYVATVCEKGMFGKIFDKYFNHTNEPVYMRILKVSNTDIK